MTTRIDWMRGCATALVTPFHKDGSIDEACFRSLAERQIKGGVNLLVPCGTTGESVTMSEQERLRVIRLAVEVAHGKGSGEPGSLPSGRGKLGSLPSSRRSGRVIAGTGSNNTAATIEFTRRVREAGADAALIVAPYYNKPTQEGMFAHFSEIAKSVKGFPIVLYNVPSRTASNISAETTLRLAEAHENIVATKEASGNYSQVMEILARRPRNFKVFSGDDATALPLIALGADGLVSVCSNEMPKETSRMVEKALDGAQTSARKLHYQLLPLMEANFIETSPAPCKYVMREMGLLEENLRLPLVPVTKPSRQKLSEAMVQVGINIVDNG
jgi:4-hydroxy-tetrahydrodipicolinate synthase